MGAVEGGAHVQQGARVEVYKMEMIQVAGENWFGFLGQTLYILIFPK